jgi:hypothetical protein
MKNKLMKLSAVTGVLFASLMATGNANASCYVSNYQVERVISYGTYSYIYLRPAGALTNSFYYYARVNGDQQVSTAANAHTDGSRVNVLGDATACPTTGTARYAGVASYVYLTE